MVLQQSYAYIAKILYESATKFGGLAMKAIKFVPHRDDLLGAKFQNLGVFKGRKQPNGLLIYLSTQQRLSIPVAPHDG